MKLFPYQTSYCCLNESNKNSYKLGLFQSQKLKHLHWHLYFHLQTSIKLLKHSWHSLGQFTVAVQHKVPVTITTNINQVSLE